MLRAQRSTLASILKRQRKLIAITQLNMLLNEHNQQYKRVGQSRNTGQESQPSDHNCRCQVLSIQCVNVSGHLCAHNCPATAWNCSRLHERHICTCSPHRAAPMRLNPGTSLCTPISHHPLPRRQVLPPVMCSPCFSRCPHRALWNLVPSCPPSGTFSRVMPSSHERYPLRHTMSNIEAESNPMFRITGPSLKIATS